MRKISFILSILGIFILFLILINAKPIKINSIQELSKLTDNRKILIWGIVTKQSSSSIMINNMTILCSSCPPYLNKNLSVEGIIKENLNSKVIYALKIKKANYNNN